MTGVIMKITKAIKQLDNVYNNGQFSIQSWIPYINALFPNSSSIFLDDINDYDFKNQCLPILNNVFLNKDKMSNICHLFDEITQNLELKLMHYFNKTFDVDIVLYLGLCNGAGWVIEINGQTKILLGIEKIIELKWDNENKMNGLIYHELGHVYQKQYGVLDRTFDSLADTFLWQLFTEGIAMYFEQLLIGDFSYYHQDDGKWLKYYDSHLGQLKKDFLIDLDTMNHQNQRYFGDWILYNKHSDAGYYLGAKLIQHICKHVEFEKVILFGLDEVKYYYKAFVNQEHVAHPTIST